MQDLNAIALVTGAAAGIGRATAFAFAESGCVGVIFADINITSAQLSASESHQYATHEKYESLAVGVDVRDRASVEEMMEVVVRKWGRVDFLVNGAGVSAIPKARTSNTPPEDFEYIMSTNVTGTLNVLAAVIKQMRTQDLRMYTPPSRQPLPPRSLGRGSIINIGSAYSYFATPGRMPYTVSKHAIIGLTKSAAADHARDGIRVNAVCPGAVDTPMNRAIMEREPVYLERAKAGAVLGGRLALPDEVASVIVGLCGPGSSYVTGTSLVVDAGMLISGVGVSGMKDGEMA